MSRFQLTEKQIKEIHQTIYKWWDEEGMDKRDFVVNIGNTDKVAFHDDHTKNDVEVKIRKLEDKDNIINEITNEILSDTKAILSQKQWDHVKKYSYLVYDVVEAHGCHMIRYAKCMNRTKATVDE